MFNINYCVISCVGHVYQVYINIMSSDNRSQANISFREETTTTIYNSLTISTHIVQSDDTADRGSYLTTTIRSLRNPPY